MKDKKYIILIVVIILMMVGIAVIKTGQPQPPDWTPTFINSKTDPYGTYITYQLLGDIFEKNKIRSTRRPIYNNLKKNVDNYFGYDDEIYTTETDDNYQEIDDVVYDSIVSLVKAEDKTSAIRLYKEETGLSSAESREYIDMLDEYLKNLPTEQSTVSDPSAWYRDLKNTSDTTSYVFINLEFNLDKLDLQYMLDFVGLGNDVFISAEIISKNLLDTLGIETRRIRQYSDTVFSLAGLPGKKYSFGNIYSQTKLNADSCPSSVRALAFNNSWDTVFLEVQYGKGHFYLHTIPSAFANINLLKTDKYDFAFRSLSYLPRTSNVIWDEYQKQGAIGEGSMFKVIFNSTPLRIALYLIFGGFLLFMIFRAKRTQRAIPVINPPVNSSLEFLGTISNLYYKKKDFKDIAEKRHAYLLDFIRKNYYMSTEHINEEFIKVLSAKSGLESDKLQELFTLYKDIAVLPYTSNDIFLKYNSLLEEFYRKAKNK